MKTGANQCLKNLPTTNKIVVLILDEYNQLEHCNIMLV